MNDNMKRKEDVNRRGRANLEQTKTGNVEIQREITRREDTRYAPTLQCSNVLTLRFQLIFLSRGAFLTGSFLSLLMCLLLVSPRCNYLQNFLIQVKRKIHKYKQQTKSLLNFPSPLLILKKKKTKTKQNNMQPFFFLRINMQL